MFNLVLKDLMVQKKEKTVYIAVIFGVIYAILVKDSAGIGIALLLMSVYLFTVYSNAYDYKYNSDILVNSLPVGRPMVVIAKYLSVFVYLLIPVISALVFGYIFKALGFLGITTMIAPRHVAVLIILICIYYSVFFPIYFRFGYMKSRWGNFIAMGLIAGIASGISEIYAQKPGHAALSGGPIFKGLAIALSGNGNVLAYLLLITGAVVLLVISMLWSIEMYKKKEF